MIYVNAIAVASALSSCLAKHAALIGLSDGKYPAMNKLVEFAERNGGRVAINSQQVRYVRDNRDETSTIVFDNNQTLLVEAKYDLVCSILAPSLISA